MSDSFGNHITWRRDGATMIVSGSGTLNTPAWDASVWEERDDVTTLVIEEGITRIGPLCFQEHPFLETVTLPTTLKYVGTRSFYNCDRLANVEGLPGLRSVEKDAFENTSCAELNQKLAESPATFRPYELVLGEHAPAVITPEMINLLTDVPFDQQLESYTAWVSEKKDYRNPAARQFNQNAAKALVIKDGIVVGVAFDTHIGESLLMNSGNWEPVKFRPTAFRFLHDDVVACRWCKMEFNG